MGRQRKFDHDAILDLRGRGMVPKNIAARLGIAVGSVEAVIRIARDRGDHRAMRAFRSASVAETPEEVQPADRPGVMVIYVATLGRNDGLAQKVPVSLPRLSILGDWQGRAATETRGEVA